jgi:hypothetical protein
LDFASNLHTIESFRQDCCQPTGLCVLHVQTAILIDQCNRLDLAEADDRFLDDEGGEVRLTDVFTTLYAAWETQVIRRTPGQTVAETLRRFRNEMGDDSRCAPSASPDQAHLPSASSRHPTQPDGRFSHCPFVVCHQDQALLFSLGSSGYNGR